MSGRRVGAGANSGAVGPGGGGSFRDACAGRSGGRSAGTASRSDAGAASCSNAGTAAGCRRTHTGTGCCSARTGASRRRTGPGSALLDIDDHGRRFEVDAQRMECGAVKVGQRKGQVA